MSDRIGRVLDNKYRIIRGIGVGGMGSVYEAEHIVISRHVAVKILSPDFVSDPDVVERFFREAKSASAIGHPNIVDIYDVGREDDKTVYIVMELLKGMSLSEHIEKEERIDPTAAAAIAIQVLSALRAVHEKGIVHRDLKAGNVFLAVDPRNRQEVKLLDFGIAKIGQIGRPAFALTHEGEVMGTPYCLSPEQARGASDVDARTDIWGVGVMLYEMLTGAIPYDGANYNELLGRILLQEPKPMLETVPELPIELVDIVEKAMKKERGARFASAGEMMDALVPFVEHAARDLMSSAVLKKIKGISVAAGLDDNALPASSPGWVSGRKHDPKAVTGEVILHKALSLEVSSRRQRRRLLAPVAIAGGLGVLLAAATLAFSLGGTAPASTAEAPLLQEKAAPTATAQVPPALPEAKVAVEEELAIGVAPEPPAPVAAPKSETKKGVANGHQKRNGGWAPNPFE